MHQLIQHTFDQLSSHFKILLEDSARYLNTLIQAQTSPIESTQILAKQLARFKHQFSELTKQTFKQLIPRCKQQQDLCKSNVSLFTASSDLDPHQVVLQDKEDVYECKMCWGMHNDNSCAYCFKCAKDLGTLHPCLKCKVKVLKKKGRCRECSILM